MHLGVVLSLQAFHYSFLLMLFQAQECANSAVTSVATPALLRKKATQKHYDPDKSIGDWAVHIGIRRPAARLVHAIEYIFPHRPNDGPARAPKVLKGGLTATKRKLRRKRTSLFNGDVHTHTVVENARTI